ncbi:MAG: pyruvate formate-lyase-activating protein [Anaerovoracaceae bacterium]|jgi:pyruvate formate lyase activating enzyme
MKGRIHSIESMGLVDGPGVRAVVFTQGCRIRCKYCHNPDTWDVNGGKEIEAEELVSRIARFKSYFGSEGGVTFSGGEPLMQPEFLAECLELCKEAGIHTCLDTAGQARTDAMPQQDADGRYRSPLLSRVLQNTDLILFDIKETKEDAYRELTGAGRFLSMATEAHIPLWLRHVVVPGLTDSKAHLADLKEYAGNIPGVEKIQLLPYHTAGTEKYEKLGIAYPLQGTPAMDAALCRELENEIFTGGTVE